MPQDRTTYGRIAKVWHEDTGASGGPFKRLVLNDRLVEAIGDIGGRAILEVGAGNGYFARLLTRRKSGQVPARLVVSDVSSSLLEIARRKLPAPHAEYVELDVRRRFPFADGVLDVVVATMVFNELTTGAVRRAVAECARVLAPDGLLLATVLHPDFVQRLRDNGQLAKQGSRVWTMPGKGAVRLPVVPRPRGDYEKVFEAAGFEVRGEDVHASEEVLRERPGLRHSAGVPIAAVYRCRAPSSS